MLKIWMALGTLVLSSGIAAAAVAGDDDAVRTNWQTVHVNRYAFDAAGRSADEAAAERCAGGEQGRPHVRHTMGDIAAAVFTGGWYTPEHVDVACSASSTLR
jgi:hypothetical protein